MLDHSTRTLTPGYFKYLLELEGQLAMRHLFYLSLLDFEFDIPPDESRLAELVFYIRSYLRKTDLMGRMGTLRFGVVLHYTDGNDALKVAKRIRRRIKSHPFFLAQGKKRRGLSLGGACFPTHATSIQMLPKIAERMMTTAKMSGANRIFFPGD